MSTTEATSTVTKEPVTTTKEENPRYSEENKEIVKKASEESGKTFRQDKGFLGRWWSGLKKWQKIGVVVISIVIVVSIILIIVIPVVLASHTNKVQVSPPQNVNQQQITKQYSLPEKERKNVVASQTVTNLQVDCPQSGTEKFFQDKVFAHDIDITNIVFGFPGLSKINVFQVNGLLRYDMVFTFDPPAVQPESLELLDNYTIQFNRLIIKSSDWIRLIQEDSGVFVSYWDIRKDRNFPNDPNAVIIEGKYLYSPGYPNKDSFLSNFEYKGNINENTGVTGCP